MNADRQRRAEEVFLAALEAPDAAARSSLVGHLCNGDAALRREVESLLACHEEPTGVLDRPSPIGPTIVSAASHLSPGAGAAEETLPPGTRVGSYRVISVLGRGGMGVVYVAEQDRPKRVVALKVIRPAMATPSLLRRFEAEAEILGRLHHPGIAQIYEAGVANSGAAGGAPAAANRQPYLAMELVGGPPLIEFAERNKLNSRARLALMAKVCQAVQHAHTKGVIHRDLKPSNILVDPGEAPGPAGGEAAGARNGSAEGGQPKVLDFGVARVTDSDVHMTTMGTTVGQLIGTLAYMSPEQVAGDSHAVDTRSDVYALGVILYQLLTGRLPHDVSNRPLPEAARVIRDESPSRLSAVSRVFRGDVDTIVGKAMEKDRERRYQSAADLGSDITRYLAGEPIVARRDSAMYVLRKQLRRYQALVIFAAAALVLIIGAGVYAAVQAAAYRRLAETRAVELSNANVEIGRQLGLTGNLVAAEEMIWREQILYPKSRFAHWALWELYSRHPVLRAAPFHGLSVTTAAPSGDGSRIAVGSRSGEVQIWDGGFTSCLRRFEAHEDGVQVAMFSPGARVLFTGGTDGRLRSWDVATGELIRSVDAHSKYVACAELSPDGATVATGGGEGGLVLWDAATLARRAVLVESSDPFTDVAFSADGKVVAASARSASIRVWDAATGEPMGALPNTRGDTYAIAFSPDGRLLASSSREYGVSLHDLDEGVRVANVHQTAAVRWLLFTPDGSELMTVSSEGIKRLSAPSLVTKCSIAPDGSGISDARLVAGADTMLTAGASVPRIWETTPVRCRADLPLGPGRGWVLGAAVSPDGTRIVAASGPDTPRAGAGGSGWIWVWDAATGRLLRHLQVRGRSYQGIVYSPDGRRLALAANEGQVFVLDSETLSDVTGFVAHADRVSGLAFSPDGKHLATGSVASEVKLWETVGWTEVARAGDANGPVEDLAFSPDGRTLVAAMRNPSLVVWSVPDLRVVSTLASPLQAWGVAFSPDGRTVACAAQRSDIELLDAATLERRATLKGHRNIVTELLFDPAGQTLVSGSLDGTMRLWDVETGRTLVTLEHGPGQVSAVATLDGGKRLLSGGQDGAVRVWDLGYYDRHIAGNFAYQLDRQRPSLPPRVDTSALQGWADALLASPEPARFVPPLPEPEDEDGPASDERVGG